MKIIAFGHRKRVGKDTATKFALAFARMLRPDLKIGILSFGNIIKDVAYHMYSWGGLEQAFYYENHPDEIEVALPPIGKSPRQIWDHIGLMGREISGRTWVEIALKNVDSDLLICKDCRGLEEFELTKKVGGCCVRIDRKSVPIGGPVDEILARVEWNLIIENDFDLKTLNRNVKDIVGILIENWFPRS